jgi:predicted Fe-Mo cluster-binding NifX family protein
MRIAIPTRGKRKLANRVADTFSRAPHFTIVTVEDNRIKDVEVIDNPGMTPPRGAGPLAASVLKDNHVNMLLTSEMGPGARDILEAYDIKIEIVQEGKWVSDVIESYIASL